MSKYQFTKDWFNWAPAVWEQLIPLLPENAVHRNFLEVGSFEGRSAVWTVENMMQPGDSIICIDTWEGGEEHVADDMNGAFKRFCCNMDCALVKKPGIKYEWLKQNSVNALACLLAEERLFEFIYIDGSHVAKDVLTDACVAWELLCPRGIMVFDDYMWGHSRDILHRPKLAIDAFCNIFAEEIDVVHVAYQLVVRKK